MSPTSRNLLAIRELQLERYKNERWVVRDELGEREVERLSYSADLLAVKCGSRKSVCTLVRESWVVDKWVPDKPADELRAEKAWVAVQPAWDAALTRARRDK